MKELYTNNLQDCNDLSHDERAEMEAAFNAMTPSDDRLPNPEDFGLPAGTPDPFSGEAA